jgi:hypothetical protein
MHSRKSHADEFRQLIEQCVNERILADFPIHGNTSWTPHRLATTALLWCWSSKQTLMQRFFEARDVVGRLLETKLPRCWQGFIKKLRADHPQLIGTLLQTLRTQSLAISRKYQSVAGRHVFSVDGTRLELPRTEDNELVYGTMQHQGQNASHPTLWLTLVWDVGSRLPWDWRHGPTNSSERHHFAEMLEDLPPRSIITADAGYQGYELWNSVIEQGHDFVIRVGGNVRLLNEYWEVSIADDLVYLWPDRVQRQQRAPLKVRLLRIETDKEPIFLVTSILDPEELSLKAAAEIYRQRWGVEVFFREHKQTFEQSRLRSHAARNVGVELDWSLLALWIVKLSGVRELDRQDRTPEELSVKGALRAIRDEITRLQPIPEKSLCLRLAAVKDDGYRRRNKQSRNYPRKKKRRKPPGPPRVSVMSPKTRNLLRSMRLE